MRFLILFLICFNISASQWIPLDSVGIEQVGQFNILPTKARCEKINSRSCSEIIGHYNYRTFSAADEMINDASKPKHEAASNITACVDADDCSLKLADQLCESNTGHYALINAESTEVYCTKVVGYDQKPSGRKIVIEDAAKKTVNDASILASDNSKKAYRDSLISILIDLDAGKTLTPVQTSKVLKHALKDLN
ncbi:MAG: hypothetical protein IMF01_09350 [Proteobacteria bacterium]|nr:hypothetical protein [Pseudomonadota bacterium]